MSGKTVFVTVGTTKFDDLITTVLSRAVLEALSARNYKRLILQIGNSNLEPDCTARYGFHKIETFGLSPSIGEYLQLADLVISHAGAGSVLEALEKRKHLIVVTNDLLMDNHQIELAEQLYKDEHLYYCTCRNLLHVIETMDLSKLKPFTNDKSADIANFIDKVIGFR
ncbi:PREDICTED: UDP-N-acetylglucosamine transferase subunit ALG13 homolog [Wasmannia auropunctata]|uniref:UDP-N-acetylglucosamine transferase subunit ALG13 homolog n=1 Tax=Wasmannia auropunctata TaxID=64793 RepID=UPI0005EF7F07|nr:PREDICTED: UDP-N-acetylglucosamine transferase subunit ALG13 homolog [Wasmannia auropunctata]XP_011708354.1 PREDICTED: UDP-N-acetylglucosamine transferase subunit ALG13 homolog [Wasmannia auropunctata]XP_011708355.1 PREDICTED: UDP-N-acetylglucosamine transferase subunit ALG13 homolog [Wasmannia auropunctata]XP_011708356.1 PREDICTED: UDP-N-acetylglucosamine transferase subunit ALG13 homolog [Wasmannia auropunctata]